MKANELREKVNKLVVELLYKWDVDKASTKEFTDSILNLVQSYMLEKMPKEIQHTDECQRYMEISYKNGCKCGAYYFNFCRTQVTKILKEL